MVEYGGKVYQFGELSGNSKTQELFYRFVTSEKNLRHTGKVGEDSFTTGAMEHVAFHSDGAIHLKFKQFQSYPKYYWPKPKYKLPQPLFDYVKERKVVPLLIDSVFVLKERLHLLETNYARKDGVQTIVDENGRNSGYIWLLEKMRDFSLVLILAHQSVLDYEWYEKRIIDEVTYTYMNQTPLLIKTYKDVSAILILSHLTAPPPNGERLEMSHRGFVIKPSWKTISSMKNGKATR